MKQSNELKSKRINQLESKLEEALNLITQKARITTPQTATDEILSQNNDSNLKVNLLEDKCNLIVNQINTLSSRFSEMANNFSAKMYSCTECEYETKLKQDLLKHKDDAHERFYTCNKCEFRSTRSEEIKEHKSKNHPLVKHKCKFCEFETSHENQLEKHTRTNHNAPEHPCDACSYQAIHRNDLQRHQKTMHAKPLKCRLCDFETMHSDNIKTHIRESHRKPRTFCSARPRPNEPKLSWKQPTRTPNENGLPTRPTVITPAQTPNPSFHCQGPCSAISKSFQHKDEYELHMMYFHAEPQQ